MNITLPRYDKRTVVIGQNGSGKTQFAVWLLSMRHNPGRVSIIIDFKGDELIEDIGPQEISIFGGVPTKPGLYVVRPIPEAHDEAVKSFLMKIWEHEDCLVYIDEVYMLGVRNGALNALLTQGRSKHIEMIILTQRPVWTSKFIFSEANYFAIMGLTLEDDQKTVSAYLGGHPISRLPRYHALWYDVDNQQAAIIEPVPKRAELIERFERLSSRKRRMI